MPNRSLRFSLLCASAFLWSAVGLTILAGLGGCREQPIEAPVPPPPPAKVAPKVQPLWPDTPRPEPAPPPKKPPR